MCGSICAASVCSFSFLWVKAVITVERKITPDEGVCFSMPTSGFIG